jgi:hypothetical protein
MEDEIWKNIILDEKETKYQVSNRGKVKNAKFNKLMSQFTNANGHVFCCLYENKKQHNPYVHRLMAEAFLENPDPENFNIVNHKDGNKSNNVIENLEWGDQSYNVKHAYETVGNKGNQREIIQYDGPEKKNIVARFNTVGDAANHFNIARQNLSLVLNGKHTIKNIYIEYAVDKKTIHDKEDFEPIKDFPDYLVHRDSRIYSTKMNQFISFQVSNGYHTVLFGTTRILVQQLMAKQFLPNPENRIQVNHKDGNKFNNHIDNLEWATNGENQIHAYETGLKTTTAVKQYLLDGTFVREYNSIIEINKIFGLKNSTISQCCRKITKQSYGFIWRYSLDTEQLTKVKNNRVKPMIIQYTKDDKEFFAKYSSFDEACSKLDITKDQLLEFCNTEKSFVYNNIEYMFLSNIA